MTTIDDLLQLWEEHRDAGNPVSPEQLCAETPELLKELKWTIHALAAVESRFGLISTVPENATKSSEGSHPCNVHDRVLVSSEYRIEHLHASGGLGSVYLAIDPVLNRRVAIKFPRWRHLTREQAARFEREARVTGRLDHPGIIPVHAMRSDSTKSQNTDRPCYVMRFVDGETLQSRIQKLHDGGPEKKSAAFFETFELRQLLQNVVAVCNIVAYAHGQGVIHRDIKPANIIPGPFGEVLLLDWGLAKVLGETSDDPLSSSPDLQSWDTLETREGQVLGTPAFASPEQLLGKTDDVTHSSDIYSLGATLFVLLTGSISSGSSEFSEHLNRIKQGRQFSVHEVNPSIPAALEAICRHAMAIFPQDRYQSALLLAEDLNRYLAGDAVSVNHDSPMVRLGRWIRRRPGLAAASATGVLIASLAGAVGTAVLGQKNQELRSNNVKLEAAIEDSRAANVHTLSALRTLFDDVVTQKLGSQKELTADDRAFLQKIRQQYEVFASLKGDSVESRSIRAEGLVQSGRILIQLDEDSEARQQFDAAVKIYERLLNETGSTEYRRLFAATLFDVGMGLQNAGELSAAEQTANRGIEILAPILKDESRTVAPDAIVTFAKLHEMKGGIQITMGRWDEALRSYTVLKDIFEEQRKSNTESHQMLPELAGAYRAMSDICQNLGNVGGQEEYSANALTYHRTLMAVSPEDRSLVKGFCWASYDRSYAHEIFGRHPEALAELSEAVAQASGIADKYPLSDEFRGVLASMQIRRAGIHSRMGHFHAATKDLRQAIQALEKMVDDTTNSVQSHRLLLKGERMLAILLNTYGQLREAEEIFRRMETHGEVFTAAFPETAAQSWEIGSLHYDLAMIQSDDGRFDEAAQTIQESMDSAQPSTNLSASNVFPLQYMEARCGLIKVHIWQNNQSKAKELTDAAALALESIKAQLPEDSTTWESIPDYHLQLSNFYHSFGDSQQCSHHESQHLMILERVARKALYPPAGQVRLVNALIERAELFSDRPNHDAALLQFDAAAAVLIRNAVSTTHDLSLRKAHEDLNWARGRYALDQQQYSEALSFFDEALKINPSSSRRPIRLLAMGKLKDSRTLTEISIELAKPVEASSLPDLIRACGAFATDNTDAALVASAVATAGQLLHKAGSEEVSLKPPVLKRLRASPEFRELGKHKDFSEALNRLESTDLPSAEQ
jgi:serine/threonine protein kinase